MKKLFALLLVVALLLPCLATGCNTKGDFQETTSSEQTTNETTPDVTTPEITDPDETTSEDTSVTYTVKVVDENNQPLAGATVLHFVGDKSLLPILTNDSGVVAVILQEVNLTVKVTLAGYTGETFYSFPAGSTELTVVVRKGQAELLSTFDYIEGNVKF